MKTPGACSLRSLAFDARVSTMITLTITRSDGATTYRCETDRAHHALAVWLESELRDDGWSHDSGSLIEELFDGIGAVRSGKQESAVAWADIARVTIDRTGCVIELMPRWGRCSLSVDELVDAVLQWFDVVNPQLASTLRGLQARWPADRSAPVSS